MQLFSWRLFRDRLPTKNNLYRRHILNVDDQLCVGGCGFHETATHLFFNCICFSQVWNHLLRWFGIVAVLPNDAKGHLYQFSFVGGTQKSKQSLLQVIWMATVWEIWKERNNRIFNA